MKKTIYPLITFLFLIGCITSSTAQNEELIKSEKYHEVGINITSFVKEFLSLNTNDVEIGPYMLTYKLHKNKKAFRLGLGGKLAQVNEQIEGGGDRTTKDNAFHIRVGYEWNKKLSKRWATYLGVDALASVTHNFAVTNVFDETKITNDVTTFGGGPLLGIQFFISSNISLATEGSLYFNHNVERNKVEFTFNPQNNTDDKSESDKLDFGLPTSLYLVIRF